MGKSTYSGLWLDLKKKPASDRPVDVLEAPRKLFLPLMQHVGEPCTLAVSEGESVRLGQPLAKAGKGISCGLHAPVSGTVTEITKVENPDGAKIPLIVIENDGRDTPFEIYKKRKWQSLSPEEIIQAVKEAGITSSGDLQVPLWSRLSKMAARSIDTVVLNAVETEPFTCSSEKLISENPEEIADGLSLVMKCTGADRAVLAVSDDVPSSVTDDMIENAHLLGVELKLQRIPQKYPLGYEKYLKEILFGGNHPDEVSDVDFVYAQECQDLYRAAAFCSPQISRVITVAGDAVGNPQNLDVRFGTPVRAVLEHCGLIFDPERVILGSIMRGSAITDLNRPVTKSTSAVIAMVAPSRRREHPLCINCGKCVKVCPEGLMPNYIAMRAVLADFEACGALQIQNCIECGSCAYICPGRMPIVELIKNIKKAAVHDGSGLE